MRLRHLTQDEQKGAMRGLISDTLSKLLYYDRKECEDYPIGDIEDAIIRGDITIEEMVEAFKEGIKSSVEIRKVQLREEEKDGTVN